MRVGASASWKLFQLWGPIMKEFGMFFGEAIIYWSCFVHPAAAKFYSPGVYDMGSYGTFTRQSIRFHQDAFGLRDGVQWE